MNIKAKFQGPKIGLKRDREGEALPPGVSQSAQKPGIDRIKARALIAPLKSDKMHRK